MTAFSIHIVEDDTWYAEALKYHLELNPDYTVKVFGTGRKFLKHLREKPEVIVLDYSIPDMNGKELLSNIKVNSPESEVVIVSGQEDINTAVDLLQNGAFTYISKNEYAKDKLWRTMIEIREIMTARKSHKNETDHPRRVDKDELIGISPEIKHVKQLIKKASNVDITVSVTGETGTGKELVAKSIHEHSFGPHKPFIAVNVAAIPNELIESELFGFEKGSFTGANNRRIGKFEQANGGTLFLDEIGEMHLNMQSKLLRALQEKEITRIGGTKKIKLNVRLIVATHQNLLSQVNKGVFRQDLYYRLLGLPIEIPPLRERLGDILILANFFLKNFCVENKLSRMIIDKEAIKKLNAYPFPGNVRELKALIELSAVMAESNTISENDITFRVSGGSLADLMQEELSLKEYSAKIVQHYIDNCNKNVNRAAQKLKIGKSTIYRMIQNQEVHL